VEDFEMEENLKPLDPVEIGSRVTYHGTYRAYAGERTYIVASRGREMYEGPGKSTDLWRYTIYDPKGKMDDHYAYLRNVRRQSFTVITDETDLKHDGLSTEWGVPQPE
jgi:hypothetical protein